MPSLLRNNILYDPSNIKMFTDWQQYMDPMGWGYEEVERFLHSPSLSFYIPNSSNQQPALQEKIPLPKVGAKSYLGCEMKVTN